MRRAGKFALAAAFVVASATAAMATDLYVPPSEPMMDQPADDVDWGGAYLGVLGLATLPVAPFGPDFEWMFGGAKVFGYNWDTGNIILGVEGVVGYYPLQYDSNWFLYNGDQILLEANARAGIEVGSNVLVFGLAGVGTLRVRPGSASASATPLNFGTVGAGAEVKFGDGWAGRAQYNYRIFPDWPDWYSHNIAVGVVKYFND